MRFDSTKKFYKDLDITTNLQLKATIEDIVLKTLTLPKQQVLIIFQEDKGWCSHFSKTSGQNI